MEKQLAEWKAEIEHVWSAHTPDYGEAVRIAMHIAAAAEEELLRQAASQALPILRAAAHADAAAHLPAMLHAAALPSFATSF
jgi:hypothetical protein